MKNTERKIHLKKGKRKKKEISEKKRIKIFRKPLKIQKNKSIYRIL